MSALVCLCVLYFIFYFVVCACSDEFCCFPLCIATFRRKHFPRIDIRLFCSISFSPYRHFSFDIEFRFMRFVYQNKFKSSDDFFSIIIFRCVQFPIVIGNNRFYRKWFEEPSTRSISTRHTEFRPNLLIDLPFHFRSSFYHAQRVNVIELFGWACWRCKLTHTLHHF